MDCQLEFTMSPWYLGRPPELLAAAPVSMHVALELQTPRSLAVGVKTYKDFSDCCYGCQHSSSTM